MLPPVEVKLLEDDLEDLEQFAKAHDPDTPRLSPAYLSLVVLGFLFLWFARSGFLGEQFESFHKVLWAVFAVAVLAGYFRRRSDPRLQPHIPFLEFSVQVAPTGLQLRSGDNTETIPWEDVEHLVDAERYLLVVGEENEFFAIPKRAFSSDESLSAFWEAARSAHLRARYHGGVA